LNDKSRSAPLILFIATRAKPVFILCYRSGNRRESFSGHSEKRKTPAARGRSRRCIGWLGTLVNSLAMNSPLLRRAALLFADALLSCHVAPSQSATIWEGCGCHRDRVYRMVCIQTPHSGSSTIGAVDRARCVTIRRCRRWIPVTLLAEEPSTFGTNSSTRMRRYT